MRRRRGSSRRSRDRAPSLPDHPVPLRQVPILREPQSLISNGREHVVELCRNEHLAPPGMADVHIREPWYPRFARPGQRIDRQCGSRLLAELAREYRVLRIAVGHGPPVPDHVAGTRQGPIRHQQIALAPVRVPAGRQQIPQIVARPCRSTGNSGRSRSTEHPSTGCPTIRSGSDGRHRAASPQSREPSWYPAADRSSAARAGPCPDPCAGPARWRRVPAAPGPEVEHQARRRRDEGQNRQMGALELDLLPGSGELLRILLVRPAQRQFTHLRLPTWRESLLQGRCQSRRQRP